MKVTKQDKVVEYPKLMIANSGMIILAAKKELGQFFGTIIYDFNLENIGYAGSWIALGNLKNMMVLLLYKTKHN